MAEDQMTYLLSYPRSGNSWIRYFAEYTSGQPTLGCKSNPEDLPLCKNTLGNNPLAHVDPDALPILQKSHGEMLENNMTNRLLFITRHPYTAIRREKGKVTRQYLQEYNQLLDIFEGWKGDKLLVKYETLIKTPEETFGHIGEFLHLNKASVENFLNNHDEHQQYSIQLYSEENTGLAPKGKSISKGKNIKVKIPLGFQLMHLSSLIFSGKLHYRKYYEHPN